MANPYAGKGFDKRRAQLLYEGASGGTGCVFCHGKKGGGDGMLAPRLAIPPRNFTCTAAMKALPDGQLFWVIREGSAGTPMPPHEKLSDEEIWLLVSYVRSLAR